MLAHEVAHIGIEQVVADDQEQALDQLEGEEGDHRAVVRHRAAGGSGPAAGQAVIDGSGRPWRKDRFELEVGTAAPARAGFKIAGLWPGA